MTGSLLDCSIDVGRLEKGALKFSLSADEAERQVLADRLNLVRVDSAVAELTVSRAQHQAAYVLEGTVSGRVMLCT